MLGKLIKHEIKATSRLIPFIYLAVAAFALVTLIGFQIRNETVGVFACVLMMIAGAAAYITTLVVIAVRFYKSMFAQEGYLTMTLPVSSGKLLFSKSLTAFLWVLASFVVMFGSIVLSLSLLFNYIGSLDPTAPDMFAELFKPYFLPMFWFIFSSIIIASIYFVAEVFFAIALANTGFFHKQGVGISILIYLGVNFIAGIIENFVTMLVPLSIVIDESGFHFSTQSMIQDMFQMIFSEEITSTTVGIAGFIFELVAAAVFFIITDKLLKRKLCMK